MSELARSQFAEFYRLMNNGHSPFAWQERLLALVLDAGRWPDGIHAPTGAGKSCVVDVHVFANAVAAACGVRIPRRLAVVVNRRALVDRHFTHALRIADTLASSSEGLLHEVALALKALQPVAVNGAPLQVSSLRGGLSVDRTWLDDPSACSVISATPDMWGSRLLFRGYGSRAQARPREAGMLALDSVLVVDEAHLNRQLLVTARSVARLVASAPDQIEVPALQVVETTATPADLTAGQTSVGVELNELRSDGPDPDLARRLTRPKPVRCVSHGGALAKPSSVYVDFLVAQAMALRSEVLADDEPSGDSSQTIGIVVNSRATASAVGDRLREKVSEGAVQTWIGRMRPHDLNNMRRQFPDLFTVRGDDRVMFLVATQTVEVGVDLDWAAMLTELASGAALGQRFGRVNRLGTRAEAPLVVVVPQASPEADKNYGVYRGSELQSALDWLHSRVDDPKGCSPAALLNSPPPTARLRRTHTSRLEATDGWHFARTSAQQSVDPDLAFWLRDDLESRDDAEAGLVIRDLDGLSLADATALVADSPPQVEEVFPDTIQAVRRAIVHARDGLQGSGEAFDGAILWRAGSLLSMPLAAGEPDVLDELRPGDIAILSTHARIARSSVLSDAPTQSVSPVEFDGATGGVRVVRGRGSGTAAADDELALLSRLAQVLHDAGDATTDLERNAQVQDEFAAWWTSGGRGIVSDAAPLPTVKLPPAAVLAEQNDTVVRLDSPPPLPWVLIVPRDSSLDEEECRQEWSGTSRIVTLEEHGSQVAERAARLSAALGLPHALCRALEVAGIDHDLGKADERMQMALANPSPMSTPWAKSRRSLQVGRRPRKVDFGLSPGWRHEQLSAAMTDAGGDVHLALLVRRLVGTSHGYGRPDFPHTFDQLRGRLGERPAIQWADLDSLGRRLFDDGVWDELIEETDLRWSSWGCAYLEAILRGADCQVSKETNHG